MRFFGIFWDFLLLGYFGIFWDILRFFGIFWDFLGFFGIFEIFSDFLRFFGIFLGLLRFFKIFEIFWDFLEKCTRFFLVIYPSTWLTRGCTRSMVTKCSNQKWLSQLRKSKRLLEIQNVSVWMISWMRLLTKEYR